MKRLLKALGLLLGAYVPLFAGPVGPPAGNYLINYSTVSTRQEFSVYSGTVTNRLALPFLTAGQCASIDSNGLLTSTPCGSGAASIAVTTGSAAGFRVPISSPTAVINFDSMTFVAALKGGATIFVQLAQDYLTTSSATATYLSLSSATANYLLTPNASSYFLSKSSASLYYVNVSTILAVAHGGTGTASPGLVAGTNIASITGTWPNQTINASNSLVTSTGSITVGHCAQFSATTGIVDAGAACGTGSGGSGGYAVEPATVTFNLAEGVIASTMTVSTQTITGQIVLQDGTIIRSTSTLGASGAGPSGVFGGYGTTGGGTTGSVYISAASTTAFTNANQTWTGINTDYSSHTFVGDVSISSAITNGSGVTIFKDVDTGGVNNTLIGYQAGKGITSGINNFIAGHQAGLSGGTLTQDTFVGVGSGQTSANGSKWNTCVGMQSCANAGASQQNTAIGSQAMYNGSLGNQNVGIGFEAGKNIASANNTVVGGSVASSLTSGSWNSFFGNSAGNSVVSGSSLTLVGAGTNVAYPGMVDSMALGAGAVVQSSHTAQFASTLNVSATSGTFNVVNVSSMVIWADGSVSTTATTSGSSNGVTILPLPAGATNYIQNSPLYQGATFYVAQASFTYGVAGSKYKYAPSYALTASGFNALQIGNATDTPTTDTTAMRWFTTSDATLGYIAYRFYSSGGGGGDNITLGGFNFSNYLGTPFVYLNSGDNLKPSAFSNVRFNRGIILPSTGSLSFMDGTNSSRVELKAPDTIVSSYTLHLPNADGTSGQAMVTDGSGNLSFSTISGGSGGSPLETVFGSARSSPTLTLKGATSDFTGSVSGSTMTISLSTAIARLDGLSTFTSSVTVNGAGGVKVAYGVSASTGRFISTFTSGAGYGLSSQITGTSSASSIFGIGIQGISTLGGSAAMPAGYSIGGNFSGVYTGTTTIDDVAGVDVDASATGALGSPRQITGVDSTVNAWLGSTPVSAYGVKTQLVPILGSTVTASYGVFVSTPITDGTGRVSRSYGVYIDTQSFSGIASSYGIFQAGSEQNVLNGSLIVQGKNICFEDGTNCPASGGGGASSLETIFGTAHSSPTATLKGATSDFTGSISASTMTIALSTNVARLDRQNTWNQPNTAISSWTFTEPDSGLSSTWVYASSVSADWGYFMTPGHTKMMWTGPETHANNANMYFGVNSGANATINQAFSNTCFGYTSCDTLTTEDYNTCVGAGTCTNLNGGSYNTAIGVESGRELTSGSQNTLMGYIAGDDITTGTNNTFMGYLAGERNTTGSYNTAIGNGAGNDTISGNENTYVGGKAGHSITLGSSNTIVGFTENSANADATEGVTMIGYKVTANGTDPTVRSAAIGYKAAVLSSFTMVLGGVLPTSGIDSENVVIGSVSLPLTRSPRFSVVASTGNAYVITASTTNAPYLFSVSTAGVVAIPKLPSQNCVGTNGSGEFIAGSCSPASGGSSLAIATGTTSGFESPISSPTQIVNFDNSIFSASLKGAATAFVTIPNTATLAVKTLSTTNSGTVSIGGSTVNQFDSYFDLHMQGGASIYGSGFIQTPEFFNYTGTLRPAYLMNSAGSDYGQIFNAGTQQWSLGHGSGQTTNGTSVLTWTGDNRLLGPSSSFEATTSSIAIRGVNGLGVTYGVVAGSGAFTSALTVAGQNVCREDGTNCPAGGSGSGIVSPGTFTWTNTYGLSVSTIVAGSATDTTLGDNAWVTINSSGSSEALIVNMNGRPSGSLQNQKGGITTQDLSTTNRPAPHIVIVDSTTDSQEGTGLLELWSLNPNHNDPKLWFHVAGHDSSPEIRDDANAPNWEMINLSTDNAHGLGKWEPAAIAFNGVDLQVNNRAWDNSTFETLAYWHPLSKSDLIPGLYLHAQNVAEDGGVVSSSDTAGVSFFTLNSHTVGLTGPLNPTASYTFGLPDTVGATGNMLYNGGNRGKSFNARQWKWATDVNYSASTGLSVSTLSVTSVTGGLAWSNIKASSESFTVTITSGTGWNGLTIPVWTAPLADSPTVLEIDAQSLPAGTTVLYRLDERAFGSINSAGSNLFSIGYSTANATGVTTSSFNDSSIAAKSSIVLTTPSSSASAGNPDAMTVTVYYRRQRQ